MTERDLSLDKGEVPEGYNWVPAATTATYVTLRVDKKASTFGQTPSVSQSSKNGNRVIHSLQTPDFNLRIWTDPTIESKHNVCLGLKTLQAAGFALYGAYNAPRKGKALWRDAIRKNSYVIQDSGGFQLATGVADFLDPVDVAKAHALYADSGVGLDIPAHGSKDVQLLMATARVLSANNRVLRKHAGKSVKLLNVSHGSTLSLRRDFLKIAIRGEKLDGISIGGLRQTAIQVNAGAITPLAFTKHVLLVVLSTREFYRHYHVLGVATDWQMALLSSIARKYEISVTSDSATHLLSGLAGSLINYGDSTRAGVHVGRAKDWLSTRCSCLVCTTVQYERVLRQYASLAALHNSLVLTQQARLMWKLSSLQSKLHASRFADMLLSNIVEMRQGNRGSFFSAINLIYKAKSIDDLGALDEGTGNLTRGVLFREDAPVKDNRVFELVKLYEKYHGKSFRN